VNDSSQPKDFTITSTDNTLDNSFTISLDDLKPIDLNSYITMNSSGSDTITLTGTGATTTNNNYIWPSLGTDQLATLTTAQIGTIDPSNWATIQPWNPVAFKDNWPEWFRVQNMRKQYPSLDKALTQLETVYNLVKDDYDNPTPKR